MSAVKPKQIEALSVSEVAEGSPVQRNIDKSDSGKKKHNKKDKEKCASQKSDDNQVQMLILSKRRTL